MPPARVLSVDELVARALVLAEAGPRQLLGIAGAPGAGKSTLAERIVAEVGPAARLVPMDGFHLAQSQLVRLGRADRKGAVDTFDANGYVSLLRRLHRLEPTSVYAPEFRRELEEPVAGAIEVPPSVRLVVTEGNYLLLPDFPWQEIRPLLHEAWFLDLDAEVRHRRLTARHEAFGRSPEQARAWALGSDESNAALITPTADRADLVVRLSSIAADGGPDAGSLADRPGRVADGHHVGGQVPGDHRARADDGVRADRHAGQHDRATAEPDVVANGDRLGRLPLVPSRAGLDRMRRGE